MEDAHEEGQLVAADGLRVGVAAVGDVVAPLRADRRRRQQRRIAHGTHRRAGPSGRRRRRSHRQRLGLRLFRQLRLVEPIVQSNETHRFQVLFSFAERSPKRDLSTTVINSSIIKSDNNGESQNLTIC